MGSQYLDELLVSLRELYKTSAYSDLTLECGDEEHKVHKAVVCPRSKRLAEMLNSSSKEDDRHILVLAEDDPQAVGLMLHYLYHLDYPEVQAQEELNETNGSQASHTHSPSHSNHQDENRDGIVNGSSQVPTANGSIQSTIEHSVDKEQFVDPTTAASPTGAGETSSEAGTKKAKKKKRRATQAEPAPETATSANGHTTQTRAQTQTQEPPSSSPSSAPATTTTTTITTPPPTTQTRRPSNLTLHAQLYALASKYGVEGLAALAAAKFERGVGGLYRDRDRDSTDESNDDDDDDDFLRAAREAYTSTDRADRRLRDAVLGAFEARPELLGRAAVQDAIRGLELSFDLLMANMRMRGV